MRKPYELVEPMEMEDDEPDHWTVRCPRVLTGRWMRQMTSTFVGALLAGLILLLVVRAYLHYSAKAMVNEMMVGDSKPFGK